MKPLKVQTRSEERFIFIGQRRGWEQPQPLRVRVDEDASDCTEVVASSLMRAEHWLSREGAKSNERYFREHAPDLTMLALVKLTIVEEVGVDVVELDDPIASGALIEALDRSEHR